MRACQPRRRNAVRAGVDAKLFGGSGKYFQCIFRLVAILCVMGMGVQPQQSYCRRGIASRSRCILKWLSPRRERPKLESFFQRRLRIEEPARSRIAEAAKHFVRDLLGKPEVAHVSGNLVCIQACNCCVRVVVKEPANETLFRLGITVGNHVRQSTSRLPSLSQYPI